MKMFWSVSKRLKYWRKRRCCHCTWTFRTTNKARYALSKYYRRFLNPIRVLCQKSRGWSPNKSCNVQQSVFLLIHFINPQYFRSAITRFNAFVCSNDRCRCHQIAKIGSAIGRENVQKRTLSQLISAYKVIWTKLKDPANQYPVFQQLMGIEDIEKALFETFWNGRKYITIHQYLISSIVI